MRAERHCPADGLAPRRSPGVAGLGRAALLIAVAIAQVACGPIQRVADCQRIAKATNPVLDEIEALTKVPAPDAEKYARLSSRYLMLERRLADLPVPVQPEIAQLLSQYRQHVERAANLLRQRAEVPADGQRGRADHLERELSRLTERHRATTRQLELACLGHR